MSLASTFVAAALVAGTGVGQAIPAGEPGGSLAVFHAAAVTGPLTVSIDGLAQRDPAHFAAAGVAQPMSVGPHTVSVSAVEGAATATVEVGPACVVSVVAYRPDGLGQDLVLRPLAECPIAEVAAGQASVRVIVASISTGTLTLSSGAQRARAEIGEASQRIAVNAGPSALDLRRTGSEGVWRSLDVNLIAGHAYDLLVAGDGDTPITTALFDVAGGPTEPIAADTIIATGRPAPPPTTSPLDWSLAVAVGAMWWVAGCHRRRRLIPLLAAGLMVVTVGCAPDGLDPLAPGAGAAPTARTAPESPMLGGAAAWVINEPTEPATPERIVGPAIDARIQAVTNADLPHLASRLSPADVAWVSGMATPGSRGFAVLAGHVTWGADLAVFGRLQDLPPDAVFEIEAADGSWSTWVVEATVVFSKGDLPAWVNAPQAVPRLALVTCEGAVVNGSHVNNLLVVAHQTPAA